MTLHGTHQVLGRYAHDVRIERFDRGYAIDYGPGYTLTADNAVGVWELYRSGDDLPANSDVNVEWLLDWLLGDPKVDTNNRGGITR